MGEFFLSDWVQLIAAAAVYAFMAWHMSRTTGEFLLYFLALFGATTTIRMLFHNCDLVARYSGLCVS